MTMALSFDRYKTKNLFELKDQGTKAKCTAVLKLNRAMSHAAVIARDHFWAAKKYSAYDDVEHQDYPRIDQLKQLLNFTHSTLAAQPGFSKFHHLFLLSKTLIMSNNKKNTPTDTKHMGDKDDQQKTASDFDKLAREAEADTKTRKPGTSGGNNSSQHNNSRGGGK